MKCSPIVMTAKIFNIFQHKCFRTLFFQNSTNIKKQSSLCFICKSSFSTHTVFFGNPGNRKRLTRKPCNQNIMIWYIFLIYLCNITIRLLTKICKICLLTVFIPLIRINAMSPGSVKCNSHSSNSCK